MMKDTSCLARIENDVPTSRVRGVSDRSLDSSDLTVL